MKRCIVYLFIIPIVIGIHISCHAQTVVHYFFEHAVQHFVVPPGVSTITLTIAGAKGGGALGGKGASFTGICPVIENHVLSVVVGQQGMVSVVNPGIDTGGYCGGGGGASWVYDSNIVLYNPVDNIGLLAAAAGGGGQGINFYPVQDSTVVWLDTIYAGFPAGVDLVTNAATPDSTFCMGAGGTGGNGGSNSTCYQERLCAGPGAGWLSNGGCWNNGGLDEANHFFRVYIDQIIIGFGGGGGDGLTQGFIVDDGIGGGGGGYNGGGTGFVGGGGGSYLNGTLAGVATASDTGNGFVTISYIPPLTQVIAIYPNPTSGLFTINGVRQEQFIEIYNYLGQKLQTFQASTTFMQLDLSAFANGVYIVIVHNTDGSFAGQAKVVKMQ